jgi:hypothetical protein
MQNCDTVLILGSTMPWEEHYPNGLRHTAAGYSAGQVKSYAVGLETRVPAASITGPLKSAPEL